MLKIGKKTSSSNRSQQKTGANDADGSKAGGSVKSRKKAQEKETKQAEKALIRHSTQVSNDIASPDFGGNLNTKRNRRGSERESPNTSLK